MSIRLVTTVAVCTLILAAAAIISNAGPLNPPAGPVTGTSKTLAEVEPRIAVNATNTPGDATSLFRITQPGSYYLTGNITGVSGKNGIEVVADGVSLDLMGYHMQGVAGSVNGVLAAAGVRSLRIQNGSVAQWGNHGIRANGVIGGSIRGVAARNNDTGIAAGSDMIVTECSARDNQVYGFTSVAGCVFQSCTSVGHSVAGFLCNGGTTITNCTARDNDAVCFGVYGGGTVTACSVTGGSGAGFDADAGLSISDCYASGCGTYSFILGAAAVAKNCTAYNNFANGFNAGPGSTLIGCSAVANAGLGFVVGAGSTVRDCTARANGNRGISAAEHCTISGCTSTGNTLDGIAATNDCSITGNICTGNGAGAGSGAGILTTGFDNRIEANTATDNDRGIEVTTSGSFIVRNICSGNTSNWNIALDNRYGPITNLTALGAPAVTGFGGAPTSLTNSDPHANFSY